ncbi:MAG: copper chaperone PCu(A)C [Pseudomonadota bacterium]
MIKFFPVATALCAALLAAPLAAAPLRIDTPWLRETLPAAKTAAGYALILNTGGRDDRLLGGASAVAEHIGVHSMTMDGGIMRMRAVTSGLPIPAGGSAALRPGSYHLMLIGLKRPLQRGETVEIRLRFARAGDVPVTFRVEAIDFQPAGGAR